METLITRVYQLFQDNQQIFIDAGLQPVKCVDRFRGQTTHPEQFEIYPTPAIFIGWRRTWVLNGKIYEATVAIDFHVVTDDPSTETGSIFTNYEEALKQTFFFRLVQKCLDNLETESTTKLIRSNDTNIDTGVVNYNILTYTCKQYESNADDTVVINDATIEIVGKRLVKKV